MAETELVDIDKATNDILLGYDEEESVRNVAKERGTSDVLLGYDEEESVRSFAKERGTSDVLLGYDEDEAEANVVNEGEDEDDKFKKKGLDRTDYIVYGVLATAGTLSAIAMAVFTSPMVIVSGTACFGASAVVGWQRTQILDTRSLRDFVNQIRDEVNRFSSENKKLTSSVDELQSQTDRLKETESAFQALAEEQGQQVDQLVRLVKENGENIKKMKEIMKGDVSQLLIRTVMEGDTNQDYTVDENEVEVLILRLEQVEFIEFDELRLRDTIKKKKGSLDCILEIALEIFDHDIPDDEKIFKILEPEISTAHTTAA